MADNPRIEELRRRVQADPASIAFAALAEEFRRAGRFDEAIATSRAGLQRHPSYLSARVTLGRSLLETGDYAAARTELEYVLRAAPENLAAIRALAEIHERDGRAPEALEQYKSPLTVMRQDPAHVADAPRSVSTPPATDAVLFDWALPKAPAPARPVVLEPIVRPSPTDEAHRATLARLECFLASIQAARRSCPPEPRDASSVRR
jgi:tetratricopeptide (TPR) repeat protein